METVRTHFGSVSVKSDIDEVFAVDYFLLKSVDEENETSFGFEVLKKNDTGNVIEEAKIKDFLSPKERVESFLRLIMLGLVTPTTVFDVTEDYLGIEYGI